MKIATTNVLLCVCVCVDKVCHVLMYVTTSDDTEMYILLTVLPWARVGD